MDLRIFEWNVNFGAYNDATMAPFVKDYINDVDIIIFTEVKFNESVKQLLSDLHYDDEPFVSKESSGEWSNQVVIAVKSDMLDKVKFEHVPVDEDIWDIDKLPDIVHVRINENINVFGVRVRVKIDDGSEADYKIDDGSEADYNQRKLQFEELVKYISQYENVLILGDFNNGMIKADSLLSYENVVDKYEWTWDKGKKVKSLLRFYNFHLMKEMLGKEYLMEEIFGEDSSWGISLYYDAFSLGKIKNDQLIRKNIEVRESCYDWSYVRDYEQKYCDMLIKNRDRKGNKITHGYPDHAILKATICI